MVIYHQFFSLLELIEVRRITGQSGLNFIYNRYPGSSRKPDVIKCKDYTLEKRNN